MTFYEWWSESGAQHGGLVYRLAQRAYEAGQTSRDAELAGVRVDVLREAAEKLRMLEYGYWPGERRSGIEEARSAIEALATPPAAGKP